MCHVEVVAADQPLAEVSGPELARLAWHIGNRHTLVQVLPDGVLRIRDDHVIATMVEGLGGIVTRRRAPFSPELGAYARAESGNGHEH